ncbi:Hyoscyamine (6S)-dioxygenase protein [Dioscorea alata]|uniref:Hyoscyamine (6S)-dioxygenase protein n=1 Tax=Dioscorea alata TaxID=55571 RepID=A0ACB7VI77_DIOAL|nr:Hyoscyamine (6S)-dioxygenase protein [Dioscorea alata]
MAGIDLLSRPRHHQIGGAARGATIKLPTPSSSDTVLVAVDSDSGLWLLMLGTCWRGGLIAYSSNIDFVLYTNFNGSTLHRVLTTEQERYSVAFFLDGDPACMIECLESCCSKENPPRFPAIQCADYLQGHISAELYNLGLN